MAEAAERNPDKNKYKALAAAMAMAMAIAVAAAVFSLLVFCVASRFVSYWTAAKGKKGRKREGRKEGELPSSYFPLFGVSPNLFVGSSEKKLPETISPFPRLTLRFFPSDLSRINSYTNSSKATAVRYSRRDRGIPT